MVWTVNWDGDFVVGGEGNPRLTPNFRLREFADDGGALWVHRELVSALQLLRGRLGSGISVAAVDAGGLGARIRSASKDQLLDAASALEAHHLFEQVDGNGEDVQVRIPDPGNLPRIGLEQVLETAFSVTSGFETTGDRFQQVTGNFDKAGLSFGPAQWNFKSKTLQPLFRKFKEADEPALRACFTDPDDYEEWEALQDESVAEQIAWADARSTGRNKHSIMEPWKGYLQAVGRVTTFRALMVEEALRKYGAAMLFEVRFLQDLAPGVTIDHLRCICSLYDLVIQQGSLGRARAEIQARVERDVPTDQFELVRIAVEERGRKANPQFVSDVLSRRLGILEGVPKTIEGRQRANINFFMLRDVRVAEASEVIDSDKSDELARVSDALANGGTLLA